MVGYLQKLKERWESYKDPEREIVQKIRRLILSIFFLLWSMFPYSGHNSVPLYAY